jgi:hypothetical protein
MFFKEALGSYLLFLMVLVLTAGTAQSQGLVAAKILSSEGPVEIRRQSQGQPTMTRIKYHVSDALNAGDVIKTDLGGRLVLGLTDGSQAVIGENTTVEIKDLSQSPRTLFNVLRGKTRIKIERVGGQPNPYRVNTPTAVIAVRGTLFDVMVKEKETQVFVHEGEVFVSNLLKPDQPVVLTGGQKTRVRQDQAPETPAPFERGRNNDTFAPGRGRANSAFSDDGSGPLGTGSPGNSGNTPGLGTAGAPGLGGTGASGNSGGKGGSRGKP